VRRLQKNDWSVMTSAPNNSAPINSARVLVNIRFSQDMLVRLHEQHRRYLLTHPGGSRAVLRQCDLAGLDFRGMDFTDAELLGCTFFGANPPTLSKAVY
jgi:uncharacterized protein YjbI with pentapeptide repeats